MLPQESLRICRDAAGAYLEMQMWPGRTTGVAADADLFTGADELTRLDVDPRQMRVARRQFIAMVDFDHIAVLRMTFRRQNDPACRSSASEGDERSMIRGPPCPPLPLVLCRELPFASLADTPDNLEIRSLRESSCRSFACISPSFAAMASRLPRTKSDASEWLGKGGAKAKLANEKPTPITVDYDELIKSWQR